MARYNGLVGEEPTAQAPSKYSAAATLLRVLSWTQIAVPVGAVIVTIPASLVMLMFGGVIVVAPPVALGVVGLGLAKGLRAGHRAMATAVLSVVHIGAYAALALHSRTWDAQTQGGENFFLLAQIVFWLAAGLHVILIGTLVAPARARTPRTHGAPADLQLKPALWPWLLAGALILGSIALGIVTAVTSEAAG